MKDLEVRRLIFWNLLIGILGTVFSLIFTMRLNLAVGISDIAFVIATSVVTSTLSKAFSSMPILAIFAKITPRNIEATVFAMFTGILNLVSVVISPCMGIIINTLFVGVTTSTLGDYYKLVFISLVMSFAPMFFLQLIPMKSEIDEIQARQIKANLDASNGSA